MTTQFSERKITEAAAHLLVRRGGRMHYLKLLKLLYIADREAFHRWGMPISYDHYVSMDHGPVLSQTYNLIRDGGSREWSEHISAPFGDYEIELLLRPQSARLSRAEENLLDEIYERYGSQSRWNLVDMTHRFAEWRNPSGSSLPISIRDILEALGEPEDEIEATLDELQQESLASNLLEAV